MKLFIFFVQLSIAESLNINQFAFPWVTSIDLTTDIHLNFLGLFA